VRRESPARTGRRRGAARALAWLLGAGALAAIGFTVGIVAGVVAEEPELVAGHLAGRSSDVPWAVEGTEEAAAGPEAPRDVAAGGDPPAVSAAAPPRPRDAGAPAGGWLVQVGAFAESEPAEQLAGTLRGKGFATSISPGADSRSARWRVRVGPVATREEADRLAARLKSEQGLPTWVRGADGD
jgi:DedD protein